MDLSALNFGVVNKNQSVTLNNNKYKTQPNFCSKCDIVDFSQASNTKLGLVKQLKEFGYSQEKAQEMVSKYYNTDDYNELVQGYPDEEQTIMHWIEIDRHLTPLEAILYLENEMDDYYVQHVDSGCVPDGYEKSTLSASKYDIGVADFLPTDLAKYMLKGFDIATSGMILKGKIDENTAQDIQKYYEFADGEKYERTKNVQEAEYTISLILENMDKIKTWTSDETDENGQLKNGYNRPLTDKEAMILLTNSYMPQDPTSINKYIKLNEQLGYNLYDMEINDLWDKDVDAYIEAKRAKEAEKQGNITKFPQSKKTLETLEEKVQYLEQKFFGMHKEFFEDIRGLNSERFSSLLSLKQLQFDAMMSMVADADLRQKNIQILNSLSDELLAKMTTDEDGERIRFASLDDLFSVADLDKRVETLEAFRIKSPTMFEAMERESVLDYLTDSDFYSEMRKGIEEFYNILYGGNPDETRLQAKILPFKKEE